MRLHTIIGVYGEKPPYKAIKWRNCNRVGKSVEAMKVKYKPLQWVTIYEKESRNKVDFFDFRRNQRD